jgi:hypothetical protein
MVAMNNFSNSYVRSLVAATPKGHWPPDTGCVSPRDYLMNSSR